MNQKTKITQKPLTLETRTVLEQDVNNYTPPPTPDQYPGLEPRTGLEQRFGQHKPNSHDGADYEIIILATFDQDWEVWHLVQVWSFDHPDAGWQYHMLYAAYHNNHLPTLVYDWGNKRPSWVDAAAFVDRYNATPECLRFMLR